MEQGEAMTALQAELAGRVVDLLLLIDVRLAERWSLRLAWRVGLRVGRLIGRLLR